MADLWVVVATLAFFGVCVAFVWGCDRIIGPDEHELLDGTDAEPAGETGLPGEVVAR